MMAHEKALEWQELFDLAVLDRMTEEDMVAMGYRVAGLFPSIQIRVVFDSSTLEDLSAKKRHGEAGRVLLDYCNDIREAIIALVQGNLFSEARRVVSLRCYDTVFEVLIWSRPDRSHCVQLQSFWKKSCTRLRWKVEHRYLRISMKCESRSGSRLREYESCASRRSKSLVRTGVGGC